MNARFPLTKRCLIDQTTYMIYCYGPKGSISYSDFYSLGFTFDGTSVSYTYTIDPVDYITIVFCNNQSVDD